MARPEQFFKYFDAETVKTILKDSTLRWSSPTRFNDPFDVQFDLHVEYDHGRIAREALDEMWKIYAEKKEFAVANALGAVLKMLSLKPALLSRADFESQLKQGLEGSLQKLKESLPDFHNIIRKHLRSIQLLCLSETNDNILMWSHYANNHRGAVIRVTSVGDEDSPLLMARKVHYQKNMPRLFDHDRLLKYLTGQLSMNSTQIMDAALLTKASDWSYEREWRVVYHGKEPVEFSDDKFQPRQITGVYFGCRMGEEDRKEIVALALSANPSIEMFQAKTLDREFALHFELTNGA